jgi:curved DNA-binding protein CbpA
MAHFRGGASLRVDKTKMYSVLGVRFDADEAAIKAAYKKLALRHHPDRHSAASPNTKEREEIKFQEVSAAYEVLGDAVKRAAYDSHGMPGVGALERGEGNQEEAPGGGGEGFRRGSDDASWDDREAAAEYAAFQAAAEESRCRRAAAYATFAAVFSHDDVTGSIDSGGVGSPSWFSSSSSSSTSTRSTVTGAASEAPEAYFAASMALPVHNMASQRGGGSFEDLQRRRLEEAFHDLDLGSNYNKKEQKKEEASS